ncbi:unnamed protein product [Musa acuminata subsp. malaccensis]|uniref:(wild Malaysian banana) hypothetical protein n=1 Tax=Musa acuminata subsp. malaccensis TaxID=214687 RepID=A0A8D7AGF4_MUSAM|nr:unnamed protein product [Musa acuminata subsp. malaccensis]
MAGMLPGVEFARRRRLHHGGSTDSSTGTRRSSYCLHTIGCEAHLSATGSMVTQRTILNKEVHEGALGSMAREAKERLDARLKIKRCDGMMNHSMLPELHKCGSEQVIPGSVQGEVFSSKSTRKFSWSKKLGWTASEQAECAICLEEFKRGDVLLRLPCAHRFHCDCVVPWLRSNSHCPCCRTTIFP